MVGSRGGGWDRERSVSQLGKGSCTQFGLAWLDESLVPSLAQIPTIVDKKSKKSCGASSDGMGEHYDDDGARGTRQTGIAKIEGSRTRIQQTASTISTVRVVLLYFMERLMG